MLSGHTHAENARSKTQVGCCGFQGRRVKVDQSALSITRSPPPLKPRRPAPAIRALS
jgi:hypothetical protein